MDKLLTKGPSVVFMFGFPGKSVYRTVLYCGHSRVVQLGDDSIEKPRDIKRRGKKGAEFGDELHVAARRALVPGLLNQGDSYMAATSI